MNYIYLLFLNLTTFFISCDNSCRLDDKDTKILYDSVFDLICLDSTVKIIDQFQPISVFDSHPMVIAMLKDDCDLNEVRVRQLVYHPSNSSYLYSGKFGCENVIDLEQYFIEKERNERVKNEWQVENQSKGALTEFVWPKENFIWISQPYVNSENVYIYLSGMNGSSYYKVLTFKFDCATDKWLFKEGNKVWQPLLSL